MTISRISRLVAAVFSCVALSVSSAESRQPATANGKRIALLIGNNNYKQAPLVNPINDAKGLDQRLSSIGFTTTLTLDTTLPALERSFAAFLKTIGPGDTVVAYFAGHGFQIDGENYLVPVEFSATTEAVAKRQAYPASRLLSLLSSSQAELVVIVLDACRDNPFRVAIPGSARNATRSLAEVPGLAPMEPGWSSAAARPNAPGRAAGVVIQFATSQGMTSDDTPLENHSLFARHLIDALGVPGSTVEAIFGKVRQGVSLESQRRQIPMTILSGATAVPLSPAAPAEPPDDRVAEKEREEDHRLWDTVRGSTSADAILIYLRLQPRGAHVEEARALEKSLREEAQRLTARTDVPGIQATLARYAKAYAAFNFADLRTVFPTVSNEQGEAFRDQKDACREYRVTFGAPQIYQGDSAGSVVVVTESDYSCVPKTRQKVPARRMTDVFGMKLDESGRWIINSLGSMERSQQ